MSRRGRRNVIESLRSGTVPLIWPEDLPLLRELLTEEEYAELLRRMVRVLPNGPLLDYWQAFGDQELKAPNAAGTLGALRPRPG
ncbi:MAG: hypothetical protein V3W34_00925 [Phycisphaerae bacterium]